MLGMPTEQFHLEFTHAQGGSTYPAPTRENLLVLYLPDTKTYTEAVNRMQEHGHFPVEPENPIGKVRARRSKIRTGGASFSTMADHSVLNELRRLKMNWAILAVQTGSVAP